LCQCQKIIKNDSTHYSQFLSLIPPGLPF